MRGLPFLALLLVVLPTIQPGLSSPPVQAADVAANAEGPISSSESTSLYGLVIAQLGPGQPVEHIVITNHGPPVDIRGLVLSDGEGNITVTGAVSLARGGSLAFAVDPTVFTALYPDVPCLDKASPSVQWGGKFVLADSGDELLMSLGGELVDAVSYGSSEYRGDGWSGPAVPVVGKANCLLRGDADSDTASDWSVVPPGRSDFRPATFEAVVEPFSCPEDAAARLLREIELAGVSVHAAIYELSDPDIARALADCRRRGVEVQVLVEGQPVGGLSDASLAALGTLSDAGATVKELRSSDSYKRYDYLHCKYLIADGRRVVVMSENWGSGLRDNRGWGVCLDGKDVASYFEDVFAADIGGPLDVYDPHLGAPADPLEGEHDDVLDEVDWYRCTVSPLLSPDYAPSSLHQLIAGAGSTILVEQMSLQQDWTTSPGLVADLLEAAARGVRVRVLLGSSFDTDNVAVVEALNSAAASSGYDLEAKQISPYHGIEVMHNKEVIVDDVSVISSINWVDNALYENREVGVAVRSPEVSEHFSSLFWDDWSLDPIPPTMELPWTYLTVNAGDLVVLDANGITDNWGIETVEWDIDMDGNVDGNLTVWTVGLPEGNNTITLTVTDRGGNTVEATIWVEVLPSASSSGTLPAALLLAPLMVPPAYIIFKRIMRGKHN
jgi:cardiolipin synthase